MWYFYEDGEDEEPEEEGIGAPERDWGSEDQNSEEGEEDQQQDNSNNRRNDKKDNDDGKKDGSDKDGENGKNSDGDSSKDNSTDSGSKSDEQLNRDDVKNDLQEKDKELNDKSKQDSSSKKDGSDKKGDGSGKDGSQGKDSNGPKGKDSNGPTNSSSNPPKGNSSELANKGTQNLGKEGAEKAAQDTTKKAAEKEIQKKAAQEGAKQAGKQVASKGIFATPVGWIILLIIVIIIVLIGTISFFMLMPGQILGKLKVFAMGFVDAVRGFFEGKQNIVYDAEMAEVADYIEQMGYDLKGEGFVTKDLEDGDQKDIYAQGEGDPRYTADEQEPDPQQGVMRTSDGTVSDIKSDPIYKYIVSDNLCYIIRNENSNLSDATEGRGFFEAVWNVLTFPFRTGEPDYRIRVDKFILGRWSYWRSRWIC